MSTKTLLAAAVAGAMALPVSGLARDTGEGNTASSTPDAVTWFYPDGSIYYQVNNPSVLASNDGEEAPVGPLAGVVPGIAPAAEPVVDDFAMSDDKLAGGNAVTWYYPDGSIFHQPGSTSTMVADVPEEDSATADVSS